MKRGIGILTCAVACSLGAAQGASAACEQRGFMVCGTGTSQITSAEALQVSRGGDFSTLSPGSILKAGDRVLVGAAKATLALGPACHAAVSPGSLVFITPNGNRTCASITSQQQATMNAETVADPTYLRPVISPLAIAAGLGTAAAIGVVIAVTTSHHDVTPQIVSAQ